MDNDHICIDESEQALQSNLCTSHWLKEQFKVTKERDPVDALNDAEALVSILKMRLKRLTEKQS